MCETGVVPKERGLRAFFETQELKRESRSDPNPGRWLRDARIYGITAIFVLGITVVFLILSLGGGHSSLAWWFPMIATVGFVVAMIGSLRRMRRDRRRLGLLDQAS